MIITSLQLWLLLLSVFRRMDAFTYQDYDFDKRPHRYGRSPKEDQCHKQADISRWINEQVVRNAKITQVNRRLREILEALSGNNTVPNKNTFCCFYEKNTMDKLYADITILSEKYDIAIESPLKRTGNLGQDLDIILEKMDKLVNKDERICCDNLSKILKDLEADFKTQLVILKQKVNENIKIKKNLETNQKYKHKKFDEKLMHQKERIEILEQKQIEMEKRSQNRACYTELNLKLDELKNRLESAKKDINNRSVQLEMELSDITYRKNKQEGEIKDLNIKQQKYTEYIQKVMKNCEIQCENKQNETEFNKNGIFDSTRLDNLELSIKYLIEYHNFTDMIETLTQCKHVQDNLTKIEEKLNQMLDYEKSENNKNLSKCQADQSKNQLELHQHMEKFKNCCENLNNFTKNNQDAHKTIIKLNDSYVDNIFKLDADVKDLQNRFNEALEKFNQENNKTNQGFKLNNKQLDNKIDAINIKLEQIQKTHNNNDYKLGEVQDRSMKNFYELKQLILNQSNAIAKFSKNAEKRYNDLNAKNNFGKPDDTMDRMNRLERQQDKLSENIDKALHLKNQIEDLEKRLNVAHRNLKLNLSEYDKCTSKCKILDNIDDVIDRIEDLEAITSKKPLTKEKPRKSQSQIGGIDFK